MQRRNPEHNNPYLPSSITTDTIRFIRIVATALRSIVMDCKPVATTQNLNCELCEEGHYAF